MKTSIVPFFYLALFTCLSAVVADSDTIPLIRKTPVVKDSDGAQVTQQLKKGTGKEPEPPFSAEEAAVPKPFLASIGVFGTKKLNEVVLKEFLGKDLEEWIKKGLVGDQSSVDLEKKLVDRIQKKYQFPFAEFSVVQFFEPEALSVHIVLDVIEKNDLSVRANFLPEPKEQFTDPDSLIQNWLEYENQAMDLVESGQLSPDGHKCPALHCPFGHEHPKLKKYGPIFSEGVKKNIDALINILGKDKRPEFRASAAFLIPYFQDGKKIIPPLVERIRDPEAGVRNNALRVLGDIAEMHPEFVIPVKPLIGALNYPRSSDRSKAVYVVYMLAANSASAREEILRDGIPNLLLLLETKIPDQKEFSHNTLKKVSGKEYPLSDINAWKNWFAKLKKDKGLPAPK
jgi:HEAT repeats